MSTREVALPCPEDVDRLARLPLVVLVATARSGSMLVQAFLDGHPEILQWPHTFKLLDFAAAHPDFESRNGAELAHAFVAYPVHQALFDSAQSVLHRGRLGEDLNAVVVIDRARFVEAMTAALPGPTGSARRLLAAIHAALATCLGWSTARTRILLLHLHHGDWLWPETLVETCNIEPVPPWRGVDLLAPDKIIASARNPFETLGSIETFCDKACASSDEATFWFERYVRLLVQDWRRLDYLRSGAVDTRTVHLNALRRDPRAELATVCEWLGVDAADEALEAPTAYGLAWWGDTYTEPSRRPKPPGNEREPSWKNRDHVFFGLGAGSIAGAMGYPRLCETGTRLVTSAPTLALWLADSVDRREGRFVGNQPVWQPRSRFLRELDRRPAPRRSVR